MNEAVAALEDGPLYDGGLLSPADQARLREALGETPGVRVALVPGEDLAAWRALWGGLNLSSDADLLLLYNGRRWEAKGFGLSATEVSTILDDAEGRLASDPVAGLVAAAEGLHDAAFGMGWGGWALGIGGVGALSVVGVLGGLALRRRSTLMAERKAAITAARALVDEELADLILASDGVRELQPVHEKAEQIREDVRQLSRSLEDPEIIRGRAEQYQREVAALRTQVRNRTAHPVS